jgi:hypothetical protein
LENKTFVRLRVTLWFFSSHYDDFDSLEGPKEVNVDAPVGRTKKAPGTIPGANVRG